MLAAVSARKPFIFFAFFIIAGDINSFARDQNDNIPNFVFHIYFLSSFVICFSDLILGCL